MRLALVVGLLATALAVSACRVSLWAGSHELTFPPAADATAEPTPAP